MIKLILLTLFVSIGYYYYTHQNEAPPSVSEIKAKKEELARRMDEVKDEVGEKALAARKFVKSKKASLSESLKD